MGCTESSSALPSAASLDLQLDPEFRQGELHVWACEVEGKKENEDHGLVMMVDLSPGAGVSMSSKVNHPKAAMQNGIYDIQDVSTTADGAGKLRIRMTLGKNTEEFKGSHPEGWMIEFYDLESTGADGFRGSMRSSWWGDRPVVLRPYHMVGSQERRLYPELSGRYYRSAPPVQSGGSGANSNESIKVLFTDLR
jgi:hypothetical protein